MKPSGGSRGDAPGSEPGAPEGAATDGADDDDAGLRGMRAVWLEMRDEEPSSRGMADLLAAAGSKAEAMRPQPSWWQRLAASLRRPPALALATVMVLVAGAVILGRQVGQAPRPEAAEPAQSVGERTRDLDDQPAPPVRDVVTATPHAAPLPAPAGPTRHAPIAPAQRAPARPAPPAGDKAQEIEAKLEELSRRTEAALETGSGSTILPGGVAGADAAAGSSAAVGSGAAASRSAALTRLHQRCESAAERGDCGEVQRLVKQITRTDRGYRGRVAKDSAVAKCLAAETSAD